MLLGSFHFTCHWNQYNEKDLAIANKKGTLLWTLCFNFQKNNDNFIIIKVIFIVWNVHVQKVKSKLNIIALATFLIKNYLLCFHRWSNALNSSKHARVHTCVGPWVTLKKVWYVLRGLMSLGLFIIKLITWRITKPKTFKIVQILIYCCMTFWWLIQVHRIGKWAKMGINVE